MRTTYRELIKQLSALSEEQKDCDLAFKDDEGEYYEIHLVVQEHNDDVLDDGNPIFCRLEEN